MSSSDVLSGELRTHLFHLNLSKPQWGLNIHVPPGEFVWLALLLTGILPAGQHWNIVQMGTKSPIWRTPRVFSWTGSAVQSCSFSCQTSSSSHHSSSPSSAHYSLHSHLFLLTFPASHSLILSQPDTDFSFSHILWAPLATIPTDKVNKRHTPDILGISFDLKKLSLNLSINFL